MGVGVEMGMVWGWRWYVGGDGVGVGVKMVWGWRWGGGGDGVRVGRSAPEGKDYALRELLLARTDCSQYQPFVHHREDGEGGDEDDKH